jgi:hypothetical protein
MTKYTGPQKPLPTRTEIISDKAELIIFAVLAVVFVLIMVLT